MSSSSSANSASLFCIDAFTTERFRGNPAVVCFLDEAADDAWMQALAAEMNVSDTAFVVPRHDGHDVRWFTPAVEVELCGHATLAAAHALWESGRLAPDAPARFHTRRQGTLIATRVGDEIAIDFPAARSTPVDEPAGLSAALGTRVAAVARNDLHHLAELDDEATVRALTPDFGALRAVDVEAVAVTARSNDRRYDFVSRYFAPKWGIDEDPVTGSAHTSLGPYWSAKLGKTHLIARQISRRGGELTIDDHGDRVTITGHAITIWSGTVAP
jgi:predicted PhzF superfamily epimerase YddE/YHI9